MHSSFTSSRCKSENSPTFWKTNFNNKVEFVDFVGQSKIDPFHSESIKETYHAMDVVCKTAEMVNKQAIIPEETKSEVMENLSLFK
jgi:hypothetical protein